MEFVVLDAAVDPESLATLCEAASDAEDAALSPADATTTELSGVMAGAATGAEALLPGLDAVGWGAATFGLAAALAPAAELGVVRPAD